jgi:hypothetical protein
MRRAMTVVLVLLAVGCTGPVRSYGVYASKAAYTARQVASSVATAELAVRAATRGRTFGRTAAQTLAESAADAGSSQGTFDAIQPPDHRSDRLRSELDDLLQPAVGQLEDLRTAARRGDVAGMERAAAPLPKLASELQDFAEAHQ